jgi:hypothetical protein
MQIYEKVIEDTVVKNRIEKDLLEGKQVKELISQIIDATPDVVKWKDLNDEAKTTFIDGYIRKLMQNVGIKEWAKDKIKTYFDAEVSNSMAAAIIADSQNLISNRRIVFYYIPVELQKRLLQVLYKKKLTLTNFHSITTYFILFNAK